MTTRGESDSGQPQGASSVPWENLDRYLFGEDQALEGWVAAHPEAKSELESVRAVVRNPMPDAPAVTGDTLWAAMSTRVVGESEKAAMAAAARRKAIEWRKRTFEIAGIAAVALVAVIVVHPHFGSSSDISGQLPLGAIPDSNVTVSAPALSPTPAPAPVPPPQQPAATNTTSETPTHTSSKVEHPPVTTGPQDSTVASNASVSTPPPPPLDPSDVANQPVASIADERPGAANTDWP